MPILMDNYGGSADQLVIMQIVTYNWGPTADQLWAGQLYNLALIPKGGNLHTTENQATGHWNQINAEGKIRFKG